MIHLKHLPPLPEGWHYEPHDHDPEVFHIVWPDHGAVSVHMKRRNLGLGWTIPHPIPKIAMPTGPGWLATLVEQAVRKLRAAWDDTPSSPSDEKGPT